MYIGIDLGGTNIAAGVIDDAGQILHSAKVPTNAPRSAEAIANDIIELCKRLINECQGEVKGIGIGVPGPVYETLKSLYNCVNLGWEKVDLAKLIEPALGLPVYLDNDANLAALAEFEVGALKDVQNGLLLTLGTGVGGGIIINKEVFRGSHGLGTELGHTFVGENFYDCNCGKHGCLETFASATAIIKHAEKLLSEEASETSVLNNAEVIDAKSIFDAAKSGDVLALMAVERYVNYLSAGIGNFINILAIVK